MKIEHVVSPPSLSNVARNADDRDTNIGDAGAVGAQHLAPAAAFCRESPAACNAGSDSREAMLRALAPPRMAPDAHAQALHAQTDAAIRAMRITPYKGINFRDIQPLFSEPQAFSALLDAAERRLLTLAPDHLLAMEARGYLLAGPLADRLGLGIVPATRRSPPTKQRGTDRVSWP